VGENLKESEERKELSRIEPSGDPTFAQFAEIFASEDEPRNYRDLIAALILDRRSPATEQQCSQG